MSIAYTVLLANGQAGFAQDGYTFTEERLYETNSLEAALAEAPPYSSMHPTLGCVVNTVTVKSVDTNTRVLMTINWGPRQKNDKQSPNQYGEVWEWTMVAQTKHTTSAPKVGYGVMAWDRIEGLDGVAPKDLMIGFDGKEYKGAEIYAPTGDLRVSKEYRVKSDVNSDFRKLIYGAQAKCNLAAWFDWAPAEILFLGANIRIGADATTVDFNFIFGKTVETLDFLLHQNDYTEQFETLALGPIEPFVYVWQEPFTKIALPNGLGVPPQKAFPGPKNVKIAQMYDEISFDDFGLSGPD